MLFGVAKQAQQNHVPVSRNKLVKNDTSMYTICVIGGMNSMIRHPFAGKFWLAPEQLSSWPDRPACSPEVDVYAAGVVLKEVFCRNTPYSECEDLEIDGGSYVSSWRTDITDLR